MTSRPDQQHLPAAASDRPTLRSISPTQWKSGIAAWLGWTFDGLDMHLYTLVATPFVAELIGASLFDKRVGAYTAWIQGAFLLGWALGGGFFGRIGDRLGRSRALCLTILTYALFTGLSSIAQTWWQLLIFRFVAALGIGGEWAVGASLLTETWPKTWRPWMAAVLQTGVSLGVLMAAFAGYAMSGLGPRYVFLVGVLPAFLVLWIRRAVPEPDEWHEAKAATEKPPGVLDLFRRDVRRTTIVTILVCATSLSAHWAYVFWSAQHVRNLPDTAAWTPTAKNQIVSTLVIYSSLASIAGNFAAGGLAKLIGYRKAIALMCLGYAAAICGTFVVARDIDSLIVMIPAASFFCGFFALFTMYLPPMFPTLLRTTGAGFSYNIGRIVAAGGTVFFGLAAPVADYRQALFYTGVLFIPAAAFALLLREPKE